MCDVDDARGKKKQVLEFYILLSHEIQSSEVSSHLKLEALRERRPHWLRQIITPILSTGKMLSFGGVRLTPKVLDHYLHHDLVMLQLVWCFLLIYSSLKTDHHQNLISYSLYYPGHSHKISSQSIRDFLSTVVHKQTDRETNATKNITSFCLGGNYTNGQ